MNLTEHFSLEELTRSSKAERFGIDNTCSALIVARLNVLAHGLEDVRALLGFPLHIDSGYRSPALNAAVGGAKDSAHMDGYAADFICDPFGDALSIVKAIKSSGIKFDQCIQEGSWTHISFDPRLRCCILTAHFSYAGTTYTVGV